MRKKRIRTWAIVVGVVVVVLCVLFWKLPRPLLSHFHVEAPNAGWTLLFRGREDARKLEFEDAESIRPLWEAIGKTKVRHMGGITTSPWRTPYITCS